jgi:hypothetical protein
MATQGSYQEIHYLFAKRTQSCTQSYRLLLGLHNFIPNLFTADYFLMVISSNGYYEVLPPYPQ